MSISTSRQTAQGGRSATDDRDFVRWFGVGLAIGAVGLVKASNVACTSSSFGVLVGASAVTVLRSNGGIDDSGAFCGEVKVDVMTLTGQMFCCWAGRAAAGSGLMVGFRYSEESDSFFS